MNTPRFRRLPPMLARGTLLLAMLLAACSGDPALDGFDTGGGGGSGGGIGGSGIVANDVSIGTIDGFGSIILNGRHFNVDSATVRINDRDASAADLAVGMQVQADVDFDSLTATAVRYVAAVSAPVESLDTLNGVLTMLGQRVLLTATTIYDGVTLTGIATGQSLEVSGPVNAAGDIVATLVRPSASTDTLLLSGTVGSLDTVARRFVIGTLQVSYADADLSNLDDATPRAGEPVFVTAARADYAAGSGTLAAARVVPANLANAEVGSRIELSGVVTAYTGSTAFSVNGRAVSAATDTPVVLANGAASSLTRIALNGRVEVEGRLDANGVLQADRIIIIPSENSEIVGTVDAVDTGNGTVTVLGVTVQTSSTTRFKGEDDRPLSLLTLATGDYVQVKAAFEGDSLLASVIERDKPDSEAELQGPVTHLDAGLGEISVLGVAIVAGPDTEFELSEDDNTSLQSFLSSLAVGDVVKVKWDDYVSVTLPPDSIELER